MAEDVRCSDAAREREDPMVGTAPPQRRLLLVEQDGGWRPDAISSLPVEEALREEITRRAGQARARVLLIRRPGRQTSGVCLMRSWCVVDPYAPVGHRVTWGTWAYPVELLSALDRLEELAAMGEEATSSPDPGTSSTPPGHDDPVLLVCTHGKKDVCCAVRGRPVSAALAARWPEETWECSHTGGDRFAANLIVAPEGATYGGLDPDRAVEVVERHHQGRPETAYLRGQIGLSRPAQAAVVAVQSRTGAGWASLADLQVVPVPGTVLDEQEVSARADELGTSGAPVARWQVSLTGSHGERWLAEVSEHLRPAAALTCTSLRLKHSRVPVVESLTTMPG